MRVTVITPTYNRALFLPQTIESVLQQDYPNIEYIVLDDGSSDDTAEVIEPYKDKLLYLQHPNMGESKTVNKGYELASGEVVLVVNSDDPLWDHRAISKAMAYFIEDPKVMMLYPDWVLINQEGTVLNEVKLPLYSIEEMLMEFNVALGPGIFIRQNIFPERALRNTDLKYTGDLDLSFRIIREGKKVVHLPEAIASHRVHPDSESSKSQGAIMANEVFRLCMESFKEDWLLPAVCISERKKIIALAAYNAAMTSGNIASLRMKWFLTALYYNKFRNNITYSTGRFIKLDLWLLFFKAMRLSLNKKNSDQ